MNIFFLDFMIGMAISFLLFILYKSSYIFPLSIYAGAACLSFSLNDCISSFGYFSFYPLPFFISLIISFVLLLIRRKISGCIFNINIYITLFPTVFTFLYLFNNHTPPNYILVVISSLLAMLPLLTSSYLILKINSDLLE